MKQTTKYRITDLVNALPRSVNVKNDLELKGIPERTFYRDKSIPQKSSQSITTDRLLIYAAYFNVSIDQLITAPKAKKLKLKTVLR